ncbi:hypothetical protein ACVDFE_32535 [Lentzea chajnantorensis]
METTRRPRRPALKRAPRWTLLAVAFSSVAAGLVLPHTLLIAAGLLLAGCVALP